MMLRNPKIWLRNLAVAASVLVSAAAQAETATTPHWLWSSTSAAVNRSTEALASGHEARGVRFARDVLVQAPYDPDMRIAAHNLCLTALTAGARIDNTPACRIALAGPDAPVVTRRGAWIVVANSSEPAATTLNTIIADNIAAAAGRAIVAPMIAASARR